MWSPQSTKSRINTVEGFRWRIVLRGFQSVCARNGRWFSYKIGQKWGFGFWNEGSDWVPLGWVFHAVKGRHRSSRLRSNKSKTSFIWRQTPENALAAGAPPQTPLGELTTLPRPPNREGLHSFGARIRVPSAPLFVPHVSYCPPWFNYSLTWLRPGYYEGLAPPLAIYRVCWHLLDTFLSF